MSGGGGAKPKRATGDKGERRKKRPEGDLGVGYRNEGRKGRGIQALRAAGSTSGCWTVATPPACQNL